MQIKFLQKIYDLFPDSPNWGVQGVQESLMFKLWGALNDKKINLIKNANLEFKIYTWYEYPDQEKLKQALIEEALLCCGKRERNKRIKENKIFRLRGADCSYEIYYEEFANTKRVMELIVETEDL